MNLLKKDKVNFNEIIKSIFSILGIGFSIGLIIFSFGCFSFTALLIPSIKNIYMVFINNPLLNTGNYLPFLIEGSILGLFFGIVLNIIFYLKYYERTNYYILFISILLGFIISFINRASGIYSIFEILFSENVSIKENTPIGQILIDWDLYNFRSKGVNDIPWNNAILLTILILFMDIIISMFLGIIIGLIFAIVDINKITIENNNISKKHIIYTEIINNVLKNIFIGGLIGMVYGIIGAVLFIKY